VAKPSNTATNIFHVIKGVVIDKHVKMYGSP